MRPARPAANRSDEYLTSVWQNVSWASACHLPSKSQFRTVHPSGNPICSQRRGATIIAVLVVLLIVCLLAHQTARTLFVVRQGQDQTAKIIQAREVLELGRIMELQLRNTPSRLTAQPVIVRVGDEYAKLEFYSAPKTETNDPSKDTSDSFPQEGNSVISLSDQDETAKRLNINRIVASWPVDSNGIELSNQLPTKVSWEKTR